MRRRWRPYPIDETCKLYAPSYKWGAEQPKWWDQSTSHKDGTISGAVPNPTGPGWYFVTDDYINFGNLGTLANFTVMEWVYFVALPGEHCIWNSHDDVTTPRVSLDVNRMYFYYNVGNTNSLHGMSVGKWYQIVHTYDATNIRSYVNGVLIDTDTQTCGVDFHSFNIGRPITYSALNGIIGEALPLNRALSAQEIRNHYELTRYIYGV